MYIGKFHDIPMVYESDGRGVVIQNLTHQTGKQVLVMRSTLGQEAKRRVIAKAIEIASRDGAYYDYFAVVYSCIPRILKEKFPFLPIPSHYVRDKMMICSEAIAEAFWENKIPVLPQGIVPLPEDFKTSKILHQVLQGSLLKDVLP